ncbi:hypothetical protein C8R43DRAFT_946669 [Mycena crocata]|nr:hypothetical protein C8R43DRAFT_946669 [Mycena crocata]
MEDTSSGSFDVERRRRNSRYRRRRYSRCDGSKIEFEMNILQREISGSKFASVYSVEKSAEGSQDDYELGSFSHVLLDQLEVVLDSVGVGLHTRLMKTPYLRRLFAVAPFDVLAGPGYPQAIEKAGPLAARLEIGMFDIPMVEGDLLNVCGDSSNAIPNGVITFLAQFIEALVVFESLSIWNIPALGPVYISIDKNRSSYSGSNSTAPKIWIPH